MKGEFAPLLFKMNGDIMSISKDDLLKRREELVTDYDKQLQKLKKAKLK